MRIGLFLAYWPWFSASEQVELSVLADELGLDSVWISEAWGQDAVSVAEQVTRVRPIGKRPPERGVQDTGTALSMSSRAVTAYLTRARSAPRAARMVLLTAPLSVGGVTSKSSPGTASVPVHVSVPLRPLGVNPLRMRSTVPLPDAPA